MGLPNTLSGNIGLIVFVVFIIGIAASDIYPDESASVRNAQQDFSGNLNIIINSTSPTAEEGFWNSLAGVGNYLMNFFDMIISFLYMVIQYEILFISIAAIVPTEFYLLFALLQISTIVSIILLIALAGK